MMEDAMAQRKRPTTQAAISLTHPNAAGIDIGSAAHFLAVPPVPRRPARARVHQLHRRPAPVGRLARRLRCGHRGHGVHRGLLDAFDFCGTQLAECDAQVQAQLQALHVREDEPAKGKKRGRARNAPKFDLRTQLFQMCGVDLTRIDGIDVTTALGVVSEVGADMGKFPSDKHFASWLGLCPGTKITGGKVMSGKTKRCANRAAQALRLAAAALRSSQSALGAYYRRMCARMDKPKAVTAAAHKLARLIYAMLSHGQEYTDRGQDYFEERYRQRVLHNLAQKAKAMGMQLAPSDNTA
jgi:transposase